MITQQQAYRFAEQAVRGSAKLLLETGMHPGELKDIVCSPEGTSIEAVRVLEEEKFRRTIMQAVEAYVKRSKELQGNYRESTGKVQGKYRESTGKVQGKYRESAGDVGNTGST